MAVTYAEPLEQPAAPHVSVRLQQLLPKLVLSPSVLITLVFVYGFIAWTTYLSFTKSRGYAIHELVGLLQYERVWNQPRWTVALHNLAVFGVLYVVICLFLGLLLAILIDHLVGRGAGNDLPGRSAGALADGDGPVRRNGNPCIEPV